MNEELRSTNEELEAMNDELRLQTDEANDANAYLTSIVDGVSVGVIVVDDQQKVRTWNIVAEEMWGLRAAEVIGHSVFDLDSGLPAEQLRRSLDATAKQDEETNDVVFDAVNRRGRTIRCRVKFTPLHSADQPGVVMLVEDVTNGDRPRS